MGTLIGFAEESLFAWGMMIKLMIRGAMQRI